MAISEFRYNKKRKHYAYIYKQSKSKRRNILISSKPTMTKTRVKGKPAVVQNVRLYRHPNPKKEGTFYLIPETYNDEARSFGDRVYDWNWDINDKRKVKRIKKHRLRRN